MLSRELPSATQTEDLIAGAGQLQVKADIAECHNITSHFGLSNFILK